MPPDVAFLQWTKLEERRGAGGRGHCTGMEGHGGGGGQPLSVVLLRGVLSEELEERGARCSWCMCQGLHTSRVMDGRPGGQQRGRVYESRRAIIVSYHRRWERWGSRRWCSGTLPQPWALDGACSGAEASQGV